MFGALSAPQVYAWGDMYMGEQITCTGRQYLRQMIKFFMSKGYTPLVMDTDGVNFSTPDEANDRVYVGRGLNWKVKEGKEYYGPEADVAEYNDVFMRGEMALDTDGVWPSTINLARKNYAVMDSKGKIKLTGNSIKSKKLPLYIEEFLDKGIKLLLEGNGQAFVEYYYEYLQKIYDKEISLSKVAQRARVKLSLDDYKKRLSTKTKSGNSMSRMAHMELALQENLKVNLGDVIMYVNNGLRASHGDVQKKGDGLQLNCYMLDKNILDDNPDLKGDYNVARAVTTFNKKLQPLMVVFQDEVRNNLLVNDPEKRGIFTKSQCELINGHPLDEGSQDRLQEDVLDVTEQELKYWEKRGLSPDYMYDLAEEGWEEKLGVIA
jgi:hypothetical protein